MNFIPVKTPKLIKNIYPKYIWDLYQIKGDHLYLTFDDGPVPEVTPFVLDLLHKYDAKATFFCIGNNIEKHPEIFQRIIDEGHSIGNHTMNHIKAWKCGDKKYIENTLSVESLLPLSTLSKEKLFRPPYGQISKNKLQSLAKYGYKIILWDVLAKDWDQKLSPEKCAQNVIINAKKGSIIVLHDSVKAYKNISYALPLILEHFSSLGFSFSKI